MGKEAILHKKGDTLGCIAFFFISNMLPQLLSTQSETFERQDL